MEEQWAYIRGYEGKYIVTTRGRIISINYNRTGKMRELRQKVNKQTGENEVSLSKGNVKKDCMVARLVAEAFIENPMCKPKVVHISRDKSDNSVENLMWGYNSELMHHMYNKGSRKGTPTNTKITYKGKNYNDYKEIAKDVGINRRTFEHRLELGWGLYEALEVPTGRVKNNE